MRRCYGILYFLAVAATIPFNRTDISFSVALGGGIAFGNLLYLERFLGAILSEKVPAQSARGMAVVSFFVRFILIAIAIVLFMNADVINAPALIAGLSITLLSIVVWFLLIGRHFHLEKHERAY